MLKKKKNTHKYTGAESPMSFYAICEGSGIMLHPMQGANKMNMRSAPTERFYPEGEFYLDHKLKVEAQAT